MNNQNLFFIKILIKYNTSTKLGGTTNFMKYNYKFFVKPISAYLLLSSYYLYDFNSLPITDKYILDNNTYLENGSTYFFDKNFLTLIF